MPAVSTHLRDNFIGNGVLESAHMITQKPSWTIYPHVKMGGYDS